MVGITIFILSLILITSLFCDVHVQLVLTVGGGIGMARAFAKDFNSKSEQPTHFDHNTHKQGGPRTEECDGALPRLNYSYNVCASGQAQAGFSATAYAGGTGSNAYLHITKTTVRHDLEVAVKAKDLEKLAALRVERAGQVALPPTDGT